MCPLELTATPAASPRYMSGGSFRKSGTDLYLISGRCGCAKTDPAKNNNRMQRLIAQPFQIGEMHASIGPPMNRGRLLCDADFPAQLMRQNRPGTIIGNRTVRSDPIPQNRSVTTPSDGGALSACLSVSANVAYCYTQSFAKTGAAS